MRSEYFKPGDKVVITTLYDKPHVVCTVLDQYHQWLHTTVGYIDVTIHNVHPAVIDNTGMVNVPLSIAR